MDKKVVTIKVNLLDDCGGSSEAEINSIDFDASNETYADALIKELHGNGYEFEVEIGNSDAGSETEFNWLADPSEEELITELVSQAIDRVYNGQDFWVYKAG